MKKDSLKKKKPGRKQKARIRHNIHYLLLAIIGTSFILLSLSSIIIGNYTYTLLARRGFFSNEKISPFGPILINQELLKPTEIIENYPQQITIPSIKVDKEIKAAKVIGGIWEIHETVVNYGVGSALPGKEGNSVYFAHARSGLFSRLYKIKKGDSITIKTNNGEIIEYVVVEKKEVAPTNIEVIAATPDRTITLFTCSGIAYSKRLVVIGKEKSS